MRRIALCLVFACGTSSGGKPSCVELDTACVAYKAERQTEGHACHRLSETGTEVECAAKLSGCKAYCAIDATDVVENYGAIVSANYEDALSSAVTLRIALHDFVDAPSQALLEAAQSKWLLSRVPYSQTEAYRFYGGPIDDAQGPEGQINAWPLDEAYIDYVSDGPSGARTDGGIINGAQTISVELIANSNGEGAEENVSSGYHAIEFLLWGQDFDVNGPGHRPFTDYTTAMNATRRGQYLKAVAELLVLDLTKVRDAWAADTALNYRAKLRGEEARSVLAKIVTGMGKLASGELTGERLGAAYDKKTQEDEQSCFSDNTKADLKNNMLGVQNVYLGRYGAIDGAGIDSLIKPRDSALDARVQADITAALTAIEGITQRFDQAILGVDSDPGRLAVKKAIDAVAKVGDDLDDVAAVLGVSILEAQ